MNEESLYYLKYLADIKKKVKKVKLTVQKIEDSLTILEDLVD